MKDRIAIPLHDHGGKLVGYAGRVVDETLISDENPRYRFPSGRERDGIYYDFQKGLFLYNGYFLANDGGNLAEIIVCESFTAVWWLTQWGFPHVVGLMGANCSREQGELIAALTSTDGVVTILTDGDDAGIRCAVSIFTEVAPRRPVKWTKLPSGTQPTDCSKTELGALSESNLSQKALKNRKYPGGAAQNPAQLRHDSQQIDATLSKVIAAWPKVNADTRRRVVNLISRDAHS